MQIQDCLQLKLSKYEFLIYRDENHNQITHSSEDSENKSNNRLRMKRRRSKTNEFINIGKDGVAYGNYLDDPSENMLDEVWFYSLNIQINKSGNIDKSEIKKVIEEHKAGKSPMPSKRELPLNNKERRDSQLFNYSYMKSKRMYHFVQTLSNSIMMTRQEVMFEVLQQLLTSFQNLIKW